MSMDGHENIKVFCLNTKIDISDDFRCLFLKEKCNVTVNSVYDAYHPTWIHKLLASYIKWADSNLSYVINKTDIISNFTYILKKLSNKYLITESFRSHLCSKFFSEEWAIKMLKKNKASKLVFDRHDPTKRPLTSAIVIAAKKLNLPIIAVPHGLALMVNDDWTVDKNGNSTLINFNDMLKEFDVYLVPDSPFKEKIIRLGANRNMLHVLGSARFCKEWREILFKIVPKSNNLHQYSDNSKIKIVMMDHSSQFRLNSEVIFDTIKKLSSLKNVEIIVKPSTSAQEIRSSGISSPKLKNIIMVDYDTNSIELIRWADIVIGVTSSILLEPLLMGTTFIYPKYFHENTMIWETMDACWTVNNYEELEAALNKIMKFKKYKPYSDGSVDKLLEEVVYGGDFNRDVLGDYSSFISSFKTNKIIPDTRYEY